MNKPLEYFNDMVKCNQLDYGSSKEVDLIRKTLTEAYEHEEQTRKLLGEKYMLRVMLWQLLGQADLTLEKSPTGIEAIHVKLDACEFFWTGWGVHWLKENFSYKIKNIKGGKEIMYAEEYLVERIKKLEKENDFLKSSNERKLIELQDKSNTILAFANILEDIMKESELTVCDLDRHCDLGIAKIKITVLEHVYHGDLVCEILQQAYDTTHITKPWEPPTNDPELFKVTHGGMSYDEYLRNKVRIVKERKEEEKR